MKKRKRATIKEEEELKQQIGKNVQALRQQRDLSAEQLASKIGMTRVALAQIERGKNHINAVTLWKLACRLKCGVQDFFPEIQDGYALSPVDLNTIAQVNKKAAAWAKAIFNK